MKKSKGYYLCKLVLLSTAELLWIYAMFLFTTLLFGYSSMSFILYTIELCLCIPLLLNNINTEALHFRKILKQ